jgi:hypothetical protein
VFADQVDPSGGSPNSGRLPSGLISQCLDQGVRVVAHPTSLPIFLTVSTKRR